MLLVLLSRLRIVLSMVPAWAGRAALGAAVLALAFFAGWHMRGQSDALSRAENRVDVIKESQEVENEIENLSDTDLRDALDRVLKAD